MNVYKIIETLVTDKSINNTSKDIINAIIHDLVHSVKFEFSYDMIPNTSGNIMKKRMVNFNLPYKMCYFEIPKFASMTAFHDTHDRNRLYMQLFHRDKAGKWDTVEPYLALVMDLKKACITTDRPDKEGQENFVTFMREHGYFITKLVGCILMGVSAINCSNVICVDNNPSPQLMKKRRKNNKLPLFTFKTLHLKLDNTRTIKSDQGGTHASPRLHLRRGHVRNYETHSIWIEDMVVGDIAKGIVAKDYKVTD